jgi:glycosyltransferase involved in cell wall biosynthesis
MKKILFVSHESSLTGAPIYLANLVKELSYRKMDYELLVLFSFDNGGQKLIQELKQKNIKCILFRKKTFKKSIMIKIRYRLIFYINFARLILKYKPDLVYSNTILNFSEVFISYLFKVPTILHIHEGFNFAKYFKNRLRLSCFLSEKIIVGSKYANNSLFKLTGSTGNVVYNGINLKNINYKKRHKFNYRDIFVLGMLGTINQNKGQILALNALKILVDNNVKVMLKIAGNVSDKNYFKDLVGYIKVNKLHNHVEFNGEIKTSLQFIESLDALLVPSFDEVFPTVILEAFSVKTPVIASRVGGIPEIIINNKSGLLFKPGDSKHLSLCINTILINKKKSFDISLEAFRMLTNKFNCDLLTYKTKRYIDSVAN